MDSIVYPKRDPFFAHKLTRLLFKSCAAQTMGQDAVLLVIHIAHTEDAARYQGPVRFWNSQLNETLGFRSPKTLNNARSKAVSCGWLVYTRKNDRADGMYFTTIPSYVMAFDDLPIEGFQSIPSTENITLSIPSTEQKTEQEGYALRNGKVTGIDPPPIPSPNPDPNKSGSETGRNEYSKDFEDFWSVYPRYRRSKKGEAFRRWKVCSKTVSPLVLIAKAKEYAESEKGRSEYAVLPSVWLNGKMWQDDPEAWGIPSTDDGLGDMERMQ